MARVRIVKLPKALSGLEVKMQPGLYGTNGNTQFNRSAHLEAGKISQKPTEVRNTLQPVAREGANLEAEKGETAVVNIDGIPAHFKIGGKRHSQGGTPLNLPDNSFIFSDTAKMKIKDPVVLAQFGMKPKRGGYTPAEIAKKYDINKYRKVLADPNTEDIERKTAEMMIANYNEKLAKLALAQESVKGFPQGIPVMAMPYVESMKMDPASFLPDQAEEQLEGADEPDAEMGTSRYGSQVINQFPTKKYGGLPKAQEGFNKDPKQWEKDPTVGPRYRKYQEALKSNDPIALRLAAKDIGDVDAVGYWWQPNSPQNKIRDFVNILENKAIELEGTKYVGQKQTEANEQVQFDINKRNQAATAFSEARKLKERARAQNNSDLEIYFDKIMEDLIKLHPSYKGTQDSKTAWGRRLYRKPQYGPEGTSEENKVVVPALYYSDKEKQSIENYTNEINKYKKHFDFMEGADKKLQDIQIKKEAAKNPLVENINKHVKDWKKPTEAEIDKLSEDEAGYLLRLLEKHKITFADGGSTSLQEFGGGGNKDKLKKKIKGENTQAPATQNTTTGTQSKSGTTKTSAADYDPYPGYTEEELAALLEDPSVLRKTKVAGKQKTGQAGTYGTGVSLDEFKARNPEYIKKFKDKYGRDFTEADAETFQKEYTQHVKDLAKKRALDAGYTEAEANEAAERFAKSQGFYDGQLKSGDPRGIDKKFGEYTSSRFEPIFKKKAASVVNKDEKQTNKDRGPIERNPPMNLGDKTYAPWWLQDIVKISGAAADQARINRYLPWQATPEVRLPDGTFYDPTRELAANAEQANIANQYAAAFTDPRRLAAAQAQTQGKALENAANIMGKYNNMNVQLANQLSQQDTSIMNQAAQNKANLDTMLYDKYTIANQQFDNAKAMARQKLRQSYIDAITNKAKTQALNTLYPNFYTDPTMGGYVQKTGLASIKPTQPGADELDQIEKIMQRFPGTSFKDAQAFLKGTKGSTDNSDMSDYIKAQGYT